MIIKIAHIKLQKAIKTMLEWKFIALNIYITIKEFKNHWSIIFPWNIKLENEEQII